MSKYSCSICSSLYDPAKGDSTRNVDAGTKFEELPENWVCPVCGAEKQFFNKVG